MKDTLYKTYKPGFTFSNLTYIKMKLLDVVKLS